MASEPVPGIYSEDAERAVIGSVLVAPEIFTGLHARLVTDDFFILRHRIIWEQAVKLNAAGTLIDVITLGQALKESGHGTDVTGGYLLSLVNDTPTHTRADEYANLVRRASIRRQVLHAADRIRELATGALSTEDVLDKALEQLNAVSTISVSNFRGMSAIVDAHMEKAERAMEKPGLLAGVPSVLPNLGRLLGGYQPGRMYLVGARPGMGKTSFLISEALCMAQAGKTVAIASLEMTEEDMTTAMIAALSGVPAKAIQEGTMTPPQYTEYVRAAGKLGKLPIFIEDDPEMTPRQLIGKARKLQYERGLHCVMVDYLQLMQPTNSGRRYESEYAEVTAVSKAITRMAKVLHVPVIAAVQLNRAVEDRAEKRPTMSDLRSTGQLEQDAAVIMFPFRPSVYQTPMDTPPVYEEAEIGIAKNRYGPLGMVRCLFKPVLKTFVPPTQTVNLNAMEGRTA
jgi:replicative DNA helicase